MTTAIAVLLSLVAAVLIGAATAGEVFESNGAHWINNPYPESGRDGNCCDPPAVEVCSRQTERYSWAYDPGCALVCASGGQGPVPGFFRCQGRSCICYG